MHYRSQHVSASACFVPQETAYEELRLRSQALTAAQQEAEAGRAAHAVLADQSQRREAELGQLLEALRGECASLLGVVEQAGC